jgi:urease accessory protein
MLARIRFGKVMDGRDGDDNVSDTVAALDRCEAFAANRAFGRIGLAVGTSAGMTRRSRLREEGSLRLRCPGAPARELEAVIINTAGGIAGGDRFQIDMSVASGARLIVTTAAAEKIYRTLGPDATVAVTLTVGDGGSLAWLPQETILFDRARLWRTFDIDLAGNARLIFTEAVVFGRSGMEEVVDEGRLFDRWRLRRGGALIHAETMRLDGGMAAKLAEPAVTKGAIALATVLVVPGDEETVAAVRAPAATFRGEVGASAWNGFAVVRLCANDGAALRNDLRLVLTTLRGRALPRLWIN